MYNLDQLATRLHQTPKAIWNHIDREASVLRFGPLVIPVFQNGKRGKWYALPAAVDAALSGSSAVIQPPAEHTPKPREQASKPAKPPLKHGFKPPVFRYMR